MTGKTLAELFGQLATQPIETTEENSGKELNFWPIENKYNPMPDAKQKRYLKKGAVFLAIGMKMNQTSDFDIYVFSQK